MLVVVAPGRFSVGNDVLVRSLRAALAERRAGVSFAEASADQEPVIAGATLLLFAVAPTPADMEAARRTLPAITALVPAARIFRVCWHAGIEGGLKVADVRQSIGGLDATWPFEPQTVIAAERAGEPIQSVQPRGALSRAIVASAETIASALASAAPAAPLDPATVAAAVSRRVWDRIDRLGAAERPVEAEIERELSAHLLEAGGRLDAAGLSEVRQRLRDEILGLGPVEHFLKDPDVSEVMVNGTRDIYLERAGRVERAGSRFAGEDRLRLAISRIVSPAGRRVDLSSPLCDVRLPDGSRANVVLPPVAVDGPALTIRRFRRAFETLEDLINAGTMTAEDAARLREAVAGRRNIVVAGNSGAGKTTLLNALAANIPDDERILTLEDAAELRVRKSHVVRLETRPANAEGRGEVTMRDLVINALRMRPDRLIVGECRGAEAIPMLQAMNTGHDGSLTTLHANSAADVLTRLEAMVLIGAPQWPAEVVRRQIRSAIHLVAYLRRTSGVRRLESLGPLPMEEGK